MPQRSEFTLFSQWDKLSPTAFRRSEIRVKIFLDIGKLFLSNFFAVLMAPTEASVVRVVVTKAPGA